MFFAEPYKKLITFEAAKWQTKNPIPECESENLALVKMVLPEGGMLELSGSSRCDFDADVTFTVLRKKDTCKTVWMSDTPFEARSNASAIKHAEGNVLVAGLGIGYVLLKMVAKKKVTSITVIEENKELIDLILPHLEPHLKGKVKVINKDIYKYKTKRIFDFCWFDIWESDSGFEYAAPKLMWQFRKNCSIDKMKFWGEYFNRWCKPDKWNLLTRFDKNFADKKRK
jgi:hypothetical protein